jgi:Tfp pilus assembly protein PilE
MELLKMVELMLLLGIVAVLALIGSLADDFGVDSRDFEARAREHGTGGY